MTLVRGRIALNDCCMDTTHYSCPTLRITTRSLSALLASCLAQWATQTHHSTSRTATVILALESLHTTAYTLMHLDRLAITKSTPRIYNKVLALRFCIDKNAVCCIHRVTSVFNAGRVARIRANALSDTNSIRTTIRALEGCVCQRRSNKTRERSVLLLEKCGHRGRGWHFG